MVYGYVKFDCNVFIPGAVEQKSQRSSTTPKTTQHENRARILIKCTYTIMYLICATICTKQVALLVSNYQKEMVKKFKMFKLHLIYGV